MGTGAAFLTGIQVDPGTVGIDHFGAVFLVLVD